MASTIITTNADALKRAAREISKNDNINSTNSILNILSSAIAGPGRNWGFIKGTPSGHYVQPGVSAVSERKSPWLLLIEGCEPIPCATRKDAIAAFTILSANSEDPDLAQAQILTSGKTMLTHPDYESVNVELVKTSEEKVFAKSVFEHAPNTIGQPLTSKIIDSLRSHLQSRTSMMISGPTRIGKTQLLSSLSPGMPYRDKVVCIESHPELNLSVINCVKTTPDLIGGSQADGKHPSAISGARKMNPRWVVVGEINSPAIFTELVNFGLTGCSFLGTLHAATAAGAILRMYENVKMQCPEVPTAKIRQNIADLNLISVCLYRTSKSKPARIEAKTVALNEQSEFVFSAVEL